MSDLAERVAGLVLSTFNSLPQRSKPRIHPDGTREWIPMSGIVLACDADTERESLTCVALATGSKCLPASAISKCNGIVLHDSHAEVLAFRALNRFLLSEVLAFLQNRDAPYRSPFVCLRDFDSNQSQENLPSYPPFKIRSNVSVWMFSTEAPCGDASMDILMAEVERNVEPWDGQGAGEGVLEGRGYFSALGVVRRKPSRRDAEPTISKSCSDKLTLKQVTSILCCPSNLIIAPTRNAYLAGLIVPSTKYSENGFRRAFGPSGRLGSLAISQLPPTTQFRPFQIAVLPLGFELFPFSKTDTGRGSMKAGNVSAVFIRSMRETSLDTNETILGGVKQGHRPFAQDRKKASLVCRLKLWELARSILASIEEEERVPAETRQELVGAGTATSYGELKTGDLTAQRRAAKEMVTSRLGKWPKNCGDEAWGCAACGS